MEQNSDI